MNSLTLINRKVGTAIAAALVATAAVAPIGQAQAQTTAPKPSNDINIGVGVGRMVRLDGAMTDLFVANDTIADVQVKSTNQIYIFGKTAGETTVYATNKAGKVVYSANVRVGANIDSVGMLLRTAMPEAKIQAMPMNGVMLLTGTVAGPEDVEEANRIVQAYVGPNTKIISRLKTATPQQVMLKVRFAEVSRSFAKDVGVNLTSLDRSGGFLFGLGRGNPGTISHDSTTGATSFQFNNADGKTTLGIAGHLLGLDLLSSIDLAQQNGLATILAEPTLTALSGETASFLAGGEFPIPISQSLGSVSIEYKQYGVGLAFTPTVLADGRISMRVRPEVSELSDQGSVRLNNFTVPALTTRRAETTVELGSGQSFMIGGLMRNTGNNSVEKAPWLGDVPILGALFRSNSFRRQQTELVIIVTPYLVRPVSDSQIALPTDGFRDANDAQRVLIDRMHDSRSGEQRPGPTVAPAGMATPGVTPAAAPAALPTANAAPAPAVPSARNDATPPVRPSAAPGFSF
jgi:pilus assembly protein CpaC